MRLCPTGNKSINTLTPWKDAYHKTKNWQTSERKEHKGTFSHLNHNLWLRVNLVSQHKALSLKPLSMSAFFNFFSKSSKALVLWGVESGGGVSLHPPTIRPDEATAWLGKVAILSIDKQKASCYSFGNHTERKQRTIYVNNDNTLLTQSKRLRNREIRSEMFDNGLYQLIRQYQYDEVPMEIYKEWKHMKALQVNRWKRNKRIREHLEEIISKPSLFLTLTFTDEVLASTSQATRRRYVYRLLGAFRCHISQTSTLAIVMIT